MRFGIVNGIYPDSFIKCFLDAGVKKFPIARVDCSHLLNRHNSLVFHIQDDTGKPVEKKKGDVLITQTEAAIDICVENLYGENINTVAENDFSVRCGANTRWSRDRSRIMAAKSGFPALSADRKVFIHPVVYVLEDADYRHGPIEPYANLSVSGVITGAYPVTAGNLSSEEIRNARIDAIGDIRARVGITDTIIRAQGDVYASYVHNSRIETFGNVYVQNEIIDSQIRCSGKLESPTCRVISSKIYAKGGVTISGVGSERAAPSTIVAGGEQHVVGLVQAIMDIMNSILDKIEELKDEKLYQQEQADKIFKKMIKLKTFHDRAQKKRDTLLSEFDKKKGEINKTILMNIQKLIATYDKRMNNALVTLKTMNASKKEHDTSVEELKKKIFIFTSQAENEILSHEKTLFAYLEKAKEMIGVTIIEIKGKAYAGTTLGGVYQILSLSDDKTGFKIEEMSPQGGSPELQFLKLGQ